MFFTCFPQVLCSQKANISDQMCVHRCYNALIEAREQAEVKDDAEVRSELCDWLLSRTLLRKARLSSSTEDTVHYFRRALIHKPGR